MYFKTNNVATVHHKPPGYTSSCPKLVVLVLQTLALATTTMVVSVHVGAVCSVTRRIEKTFPRTTLKSKRVEPSLLIEKICIAARTANRVPDAVLPLCNWRHPQDSN